MISVDRLKSLMLAEKQGKFRITVLDIQTNLLDEEGLKNDMARLKRYKCLYEVKRVDGRVQLFRSFSPDERRQWQELKTLMKKSKNTFRIPELTNTQKAFLDWLTNLYLKMI